MSLDINQITVYMYTQETHKNEYMYLGKKI